LTDTIDLTLDEDRRTALLTIKRERRRNALDHHTVTAMHAALEKVETSGVVALVLAGEGTKAFCAGDDLKAYAERTEAESRAHFDRGLRLMDRIEALPCLTIAAVEGYCVGGGLELAITCDLRIAGRDALFALPEVRHIKGLPSWGGLTRLPRLIGMVAAKRLVLWGEDWPAETARDMGLVFEVVETGQAVPRALDMARAFAADADREVLARAKQVMHLSLGGAHSDMFTLNQMAEANQPFTGIPKKDDQP